jgi:hypothetical protein
VSLAIGQAAVGGAAKALFAVPPGPCTILLANAGTAATAYVGLGTGLSASNGFPVPSGLVPPVAFPGYAGASGGTLYGLSGSGTTSVAWIVSSASGGTGP